MITDILFIKKDIDSCTDSIGEIVLKFPGDRRMRISVDNYLINMSFQDALIKLVDNIKHCIENETKLPYE